MPRYQPEELCNGHHYINPHTMRCERCGTIQRDAVARLRKPDPDTVAVAKAVSATVAAERAAAKAEISREVASDAVRWCNNILVEVLANNIGPHVPAARPAAQAVLRAMAELRDALGN